MSKHVTTCTWDDVPHLTQAVKDELWNAIPPYQRDARAKGVPQLGSGAIYSFPESELLVQPFLVPKHWKRGYGMDAGGGSKATAVAWGAMDPATRMLYITDVYRRESPEPAVHVAAIKARGAWPGVGDCAALIMTDYDAEQLIRVYTRLGLDLELPDKAVESGITDVWTLMSAGLFKVFSSCGAWFEEYRLYRRNERGQIVKDRDHLMDATRYLVRSGIKRMKSQAEIDPRPSRPDRAQVGGQQAWMA